MSRPQKYLGLNPDKVLVRIMVQILDRGGTPYTRETYISERISWNQKLKSVGGVIARSKISSQEIFNADVQRCVSFPYPLWLLRWSRPVNWGYNPHIIVIVVYIITT